MRWTLWLSIHAEPNLVRTQYAQVYTDIIIIFYTEQFCILTHNYIMQSDPSTPDSPVLMHSLIVSTE